MMTPIVFADRRARRQLRHCGFVYTFRGERTTGLCWMRENRTGPKIAEGTVTVAGHADVPEDLRTHWVEFSGFVGREEWINAIRDHHGAFDGQVYLCTVEEWTDDDGGATTKFVGCPEGCVIPQPRTGLKRNGERTVRDECEVCDTVLRPHIGDGADWRVA